MKNLSFHVKDDHILLYDSYKCFDEKSERTYVKIPKDFKSLVSRVKKFIKINGIGIDKSEIGFRKIRTEEDLRIVLEGIGYLERNDYINNLKIPEDFILTRTGSTTRLVDYAIQKLFTKFDSGTLPKDAYKILKERLKSEHKHIIPKLTFSDEVSGVWFSGYSQGLKQLPIRLADHEDKYKETIEEDNNDDFWRAVEQWESSK